MATKTVVSELQETLGITPKPGETRSAFAERLARKANDIEDDDWEILSKQVQIWVNAALTAVEKKEPIPLPEGIEALIAGTEVAAEAAPRKKTKAAMAVKDKEPKKSSAGPKGKFAADAVIKVVPEENPFRANTKCYGWFAAIEDGMTVAEAVAAGAPRHHIRWAHTLGHLKIGE